MPPKTKFNQYKTLVLTVGFDQTKHGYINPCQDVLDDKFLNPANIDDEDGYKPKQFFPSDPFDPLAGLCNVMLEIDNNFTIDSGTDHKFKLIATKFRNFTNNKFNKSYFN